MKASDVKKAVVLAAGFGTRLRPLTLVRPKPLLPVWGVPMLERILRMLESWGVEEIAVNAHWQAPQVRQFVASRKGRAKVSVAEEPEILGTGRFCTQRRIRRVLAVGHAGSAHRRGRPRGAHLQLEERCAGRRRHFHLLRLRAPLAHGA